MADRGGYQKPKPRQGVSGPGKFSKRTDGDQPIREPDIDSAGMQYGDRTQARDAQRIAHIRQGSGAGGPSAVAGGSPPQRMTGQPTTGEGLPPWLFDQPSSRPQEPVTAGLDVGPGAGSDSLQSRQLAPDLREQALEYLALNFKTPSAVQMLQELRQQRAEQTPPTGLAAMMPQSPGLTPDLGVEPDPSEATA